MESTDPTYRKQMDDLAASMTCLEGEDIADTILFALKSPSRMDVAELFVLPTEQGNQMSGSNYSNPGAGHLISDLAFGE
ncbi:hypothetical protein AA15973_3003 [Komagataeibacter sucrofermentans DSM 15973]|nr:hypothetical protein [Komagataeibacter sucrofermentans]GBQ53493.1 hypothetical protein AA15973_3003 [Komagataeibacter sucrofermentans DSM 15973]